MKRVFLIIVLVSLLAVAMPASAQSDFRLAVAQVQLWPEYDQPSMLVIYTLQLPTDLTLPTEVSLRIPASVGEPSAVAAFDDSGLVTRPYDRTVEGEWAVISLQADLPVIRIEYYDSSLSQADSVRNYDYQWAGDYGVDEFIISVQQPVGASGMTFESADPIFGDPSVEADGLTYYTANLGIMEAGEPFDLSVNYTKNSTALTVSSLTPQQPAPTTTQPASSGTMPIWVWVLIGVGGVFLLVGVVYFIRASRSQKPASNYRKKKQTSRGTRSSGKKIFCHQCGHPADSGDKFCRECGTKLRV